MSFSTNDKKKAMAVVRIFETGKATGNYSAVAVLDDGAGVSYGINQFTHRSGSLALVVEKYLASGCNVGRTVLTENLPVLRRRSAAAIKSLASDESFKKSLKAAAITHEMSLAQDEIAEQVYLKPAIDACEAMGFVLPLTLAIIYDSINHGSWEKIRKQVPFAVTASGVNLAEEKLWITTYLRKRDAWLASIKRLAATRYRTRFFLNQIAILNWEMGLPVRVHGVRLTEDLVTNSAVEPVKTNTNEPASTAGTTSDNPPIPPDTTCSKEQAAADDPQSQAQPPDHSEGVLPPRPSATLPNQGGELENCLDAIGNKVNDAAAKYDRVEAIVESVVVRKDAAKSLWTTVVGTVTQAAWAVLGLVAGVPREVWLVVAVIAAALMLGYLYRQIALGKIREVKAQVRTEN